MRYPFLIDGLDGHDFAVEVPRWFGDPRVLVDGRPAPAGDNPREFLIALPAGGSLPVRIEVSKLGTMVAVAMGDDTMELTKPLAWYEWAWNGLPFLLVVSGGLVGGLLGGLAAGLNLKLFRSVSNLWARYALTAAVSAVALVGYVAVVAGITSAFNPRAAGVATAKPGATAQPVAANVRAFVLPQDWKTLHEVCQAEIKGADAHETLTLHLGRIPENITITVPAGLVMRPLAPETKAGACMVRAPAVLSVAAGPGAKSFALGVVNTEAARWELPRKTDPYEIAGVEAKPGLLQFLAAAKEQNLHYNLIQTGTWVLLEDISAAQFSKNRLTTNVYDIDRGAFRTTPLANYGGIRKLRLCIQNLGTDPMTLQLFRDQRAELEKALQRMNFENPQLNWDAMLVNGALETFAGEPEAEALLLKYATRHANLSRREDAIKSLLKIGLLGEPAQLLQQLLTTESREHRFLAAHALVAAGDLRGQPVLATFAEDPSLAKLYSGLKNSVQSKTKVAPLPEETALGYWERAVGWEALQQQYGDVAALRSLVARRETAADPWLDEYLGKLKGASDQETATLLRTLENRYKNNVRAFAAVREVLATHPKWQTRQLAGRSLVDGWKTSADLRGVLIEVMEKEPDHHVVSDFLRHAIVFGKVPGAGPLIHAALTHRLPEVRADALGMSSRDRKSIGVDVVSAVVTPELMSRLAESDPVVRVRLTAVNQCLGPQSPLERVPAEAILLRVAGKEADKTVRNAALTKLGEAKVRSVLPILKRMLAGAKDEKTSAVSQLDRWKNDPETLAMLETVRKDPDVGRHATNVLKRYGR